MEGFWFIIHHGFLSLPVVHRWRISMPCKCPRHNHQPSWSWGSLPLTFHLDLHPFTYGDSERSKPSNNLSQWALPGKISGYLHLKTCSWGISKLQGLGLIHLHMTTFCSPMKFLKKLLESHGKFHAVSLSLFFIHAVACHMAVILASFQDSPNSCPPKRNHQPYPRPAALPLLPVQFLSWIPRANKRLCHSVTSPIRST